MVTNPRPDINIRIVDLPDCEGYYMRPVLAGLCKYESLLDCTLNISDIAFMNNALDVQKENEIRWHIANERQQKNGRRN